MSNLVHGTNLVYVADLVYGANLVHAANMVDAPYMIHAANLVHEAEKQQNDPALNKLEGMDLHPRTFFGFHIFTLAGIYATCTNPDCTHTHHTFQEILILRKHLPSSSMKRHTDGQWAHETQMKVPLCMYHLCMFELEVQSREY